MLLQWLFLLQLTSFFLVVPFDTYVHKKTKRTLNKKCHPIGSLKVRTGSITSCDKFGFLMVINHGIPNEINEKGKEESFSFFGKPIFTKQQASLGNPIGYRHINISFCGDMGEFEYLLLSAHPYYIVEKSITISYDPS